ncbi:MAG: 50S ribosomal protein L11 methyltransferase [Bdellovibrionales bacterium]|nr:50S ribosomal protein L11 methyltransferase [Bdellovibrionales bacterium]
MASSWITELALQSELTLQTGQRVRRDEFFSWIWQQFSSLGLQGVHEGTMLSDEAAQSGLETESWVVDSAEAPHHRDWIGNQGQGTPQLYFSTQDQAHHAAEVLAQVRGCEVVRILEQPELDWDAEWKRNFKGVDFPPNWSVLPPWELNESSRSSGRQVLVLNPGAGFGTGTHETTQLCLQLLSEAIQEGVNLSSVLDFGSGSGILAIGAALLGAHPVHAVEIDTLAISNATQNAQLNHLEGLIRFETELGALRDDAPSEGYSVVFANILRPVLLEYASELCGRVSSGGVLILSGLVEQDVDVVIRDYQPRLNSAKHRVIARNEWRAIIFHAG